MRVVIQRVTEASVVSNSIHREAIAKGLMVLVGFCQEDSREDLDWIINKLINLRIFGDNLGKMNLSVQDVGGDILLVSQFTLYALTKKGFRPSFQKAAPTAVAMDLFELFKDNLRERFSGVVRSGIFGADMQVSLVNDGPVTIQMDSKRRD